MILELHATPEEVMRAVEVLQEFGQEKQFAERDVFSLALALEECGSNIVNHAYRGDPRQKFQAIIQSTPREVTIELRDRGPEFDPTLERLPDASAEHDDRPPGGWGMPLVRRFIDEIRYRREGDENVLLLTKRLVQNPSQLMI